jgi:hypothetical protein
MNYPYLVIGRKRFCFEQCELFWMWDTANVARLARCLPEKAIFLVEIRWSEAARLPIVRGHAETI